MDRAADIMRLVPQGHSTVLDIGARDGHFSRMLAERFDRVIALDLSRPAIEHQNVHCVAGDATDLRDFGDASVDVVFCAEVLEHVPHVEAAAKELARVAKHAVVIGVPYKQDIRVGRTTCAVCRKPNPPFGHVNSFDQPRLMELFGGMEMVARSFVGSTRYATNPLSTYLMDLGGNPWGTYSQHEPCIHCEWPLAAPKERTHSERAFSAAAHYLNRVQSVFVRPHPNWIHLVLSHRR